MVNTLVLGFILKENARNELKEPAIVYTKKSHLLKSLLTDTVDMSTANLVRVA